MTGAELERAVLAFVNGTLLRDRPAVGVTDRLFEHGHLDSVRVLELIRFLEEATGRSVPDRLVRLATFRSVRSIARAFGDDGAAPAATRPVHAYHTTPERFASPLAALRDAGELAEDDPPRLAGRAAHLFDFFDATFARWGRELGADDLAAPERIPVATLERAGFVADFPQLLVRAAEDGDAYAPAACYHRYAAVADTALAHPLVLGVRARCRRAEREPRPLERATAFTMREIVTVGARRDVERTHHRLLRRVDRFVTALALDGAIEPASDPFFVADSARALAQQAGALKLELRLTLENDRRVAVASFNRHQDYFGRRFAIRRDGAPADSGCVAFGVERWVLAFLTQHGLDESRWPAPARQALALRRAHAAG